jgi:hypothetical protein
MWGEPRTKLSSGTDYSLFTNLPAEFALQQKICKGKEVMKATDDERTTASFNTIFVILTKRQGQNTMELYFNDLRYFE